MEFGERLKLLRENRDLSREEFANKLKISYSAISKYETNTRFPDKETINKFADFFGVSTDYLLGRTDVRNASAFQIETKAYHNLDVAGLPEEAIKQVEDYIQLIKLKYNPDGTNKKNI